MRKVLISAAGLLMAGALLAQPRGPSPTQYAWWNNKVAVNSLDLSEAQTKQLNAIQQAYVNTLMELNAAVNKAEGNLNEIYNQDKIEDLKAGVAVDQYVNARGSLTRVLSEFSLKMRAVLTTEQWQQLVSMQSGRPGGRGGQGRGRRGPPNGSGTGTTSNKVGPSISQK
jgi:Spy/CpxP family protein refolding chaperone